MIRSNNRRAENAFDALTISAGIEVLSGNPRQIFSPIPAPGTWEDDRRLVPLVLGGYASVADPAGLMNGEATLTGIEWYTEKPVEGDFVTGRISNPATVPTDAAQYREIDYLISDGSGAAWCENVPKNALIVHRNVASQTGTTIYAVLKLTDQRTGGEIRILKSIDLSTSGFDNEATLLTGPDTPEIMIDALAVPETVPAGKTVVDVAWRRSIDVQLVGAEGNVADTAACYLWLIRDAETEAWREFNEVERIYFDLTGEQTKRLTFDARFVEGTMELRCVACRRDDGTDWKSPLDDADSPFWDCRVTQNMNNNITADPVQRRGSAQDTTMRTPFAYVMDIRYNGKPVSTAKLELFRINWKVRGPVTSGGKTQYKEFDLGYAPNMSFVPADYGFTFAGGFMAYAKVYTFKGCRPTADGGVYVMSGDSYVFSPTFE